MHPTPVTLADVTREWVAQVIGADVQSITVERIAEGHGFLGLLGRVSITSAQPGVPRSIIVKLPTTDPGGQFVGQMMRVWEREHRFYDELAPFMNIRVPVAYTNVHEPPCLALEDMAPAVAGDHVAGATKDQAYRSIDLLVRHHAKWFEDPRLGECSWMPGLDDPQILTLPETFAMGWPMFQERFAGRVPERCLRWCERFADDIPTWIAGHQEDRWTLVHGDFRLDNLFFLDDGDVAVIDWQTAMRAPGQTDVVYFCANNLDVESRRRLENDLITRYVSGMHAAGVAENAVTLEAVRRGYLDGLLFYAMALGASLLTLDPANQRGAALFDALVMRTFTAVDDLDVGSTLGYR
jgi:hypothetical protein